MPTVPRHAARARTARHQAAFLEAFVAQGNVGAACGQVGIGRRTVYDWAARDEAFADWFQDARETVADHLELECRRRAMEGTTEPVYDGGQVVGVRQRYSDLCLLALLRAYRPERFGRDPAPARAAPSSVRVAYMPIRGSDETEPCDRNLVEADERSVVTPPRITKQSIAANRHHRWAHQWVSAERKTHGASAKTINNEVGTLRAILRRHRLWEQIAPDVTLLPVPTDIGLALTAEQERQLLQACAASRSRSLLPAVVLALQTSLRAEELRLLKWRQLDFLGRTVTVSKSKTVHGAGRVVPLNRTVLATLTAWAQQFPDRKSGHYVFPSERVGFSGNDELPQVRYRPDNGDPFVEGGLDDRPDGRRCHLSVARLPPYLHHAAARARGAVERSGIVNGLESRDHDADGQAVQPLRRCYPSASDGASRLDAGGTERVSRRRATRGPVILSGFGPP